MPASVLQITDAEFARFRDYFYRRTGIYFEDSKRYFVDKRLLERMRHTEYYSFRSYFTFMRFQASGQEFQQLVNCMTVNETYFMRERYQFECLVEETLNEIVQYPQNKARTLRIWSIPSSTGEEPYSIALSLLEYWPLIEQVDVEIVASDIDTHVLDRCRRGLYSDRSLMHISQDIRDRYFLPKGANQWQLCQDIRDSVLFTQVNLADLAQTREYRHFDIIFCRNLLIYFDEPARRRAAEVFYDALNPGGFIFLGHSESMSRISSLFKVRKFNKALAYQKPLD
ncbi:chemotaxis protein methyltransferase CheR [Allopseudospirillum japonicum]|uniref:Chemotaxis protein methyltransferase n=1 Tax=Allopseudospirillum japonicum TaxID=64971 RepID=A0A1H6SB12_9GAMM|nr:protein-glutamate O-methyltransferase CheR [Allopseudospirillum japonicum]SEI64006.1 chemotaxis protein methyltransferase CheR [Allopseudospirillum japonicum]